MKLLTRILVNTILFIAIAGLLAQTGMFYVASVWVALLASLILGILDVLVKPILIVLSLPINLLTMGLFSIVINALMLEMTSYFVGPAMFNFSSFWATLLVAALMAVANGIINDHLDA